MLCHHERPDEKRYPEGLAGDRIPIGASIIAIADTYDAMTSDRSYRSALSHESAVKEIKKCNRTQFNMDVGEAFLEIYEENIILNEVKNPLSWNKV